MMGPARTTSLEDSITPVMSLDTQAVSDRLPAAGSIAGKPSPALRTPAANILGLISYLPPSRLPFPAPTQVEAW